MGTKNSEMFYKVMALIFVYHPVADRDIFRCSTRINRVTHRAQVKPKTYDKCLLIKYVID